LTETVFKYRGLVWGLFASAIIIFPVHASKIRVIAAIPFLISGQCLRFWAAGVIPKYRTLSLDAPKLVTRGPYAWIRNPLYAGNGVMGLGWAMMAGWAWAGAFAALYLALYLKTIIPYEEKFLLSRFGQEYEDYRKSTPSLFPRMRNFKEKLASSHNCFDGEKSWSMERHSLRMNILVTAVVLARLYFS
jgi:protein-S-isoprenylcysteine O-methyltransferase Ste14